MSFYQNYDTNRCCFTGCGSTLPVTCIWKYNLVCKQHQPIVVKRILHHFLSNCLSSRRSFPSRCFYASGSNGGKPPSSFSKSQESPSDPENTPSSLVGFFTLEDLWNKLVKKESQDSSLQKPNNWEQVLVSKDDEPVSLHSSCVLKR